MNIKGDELLNITAHDHVYFCDLTDIGAEEEVDKVPIDSGMSWNVGRRIVELDILARNMFCSFTPTRYSVRACGRVWESPIY